MPPSDIVQPDNILLELDPMRHGFHLRISDFDTAVRLSEPLIEVEILGHALETGTTGFAPPEQANSRRYKHNYVPAYPETDIFAAAASLLRTCVGGGSLETYCREGRTFKEHHRACVDVRLFCSVSD